MWQKQISIICCILLLTGLLLCSCKKIPNMPENDTDIADIENLGVIESKPDESPLPIPSPSTAYPIIESRKSVDGKIESYLTGEWIEEEKFGRRPIAVMIPNNTAALPQYGLSRASIIYEAPVEGRITRLMAILEDFDDLDRIGPVRSSRDYFLYQAMGYEAIYCNWGLARPYVEELINRPNYLNISAAVSGIYNPASEAFDRIPRKGYPLEFTGYLMIDGLFRAVERLGYDWNLDDKYVPPFLFVADGTFADYPDEEDAQILYPGSQSTPNSGGYGNSHPYFVYDKKAKLYYRYQYGEKQIDEYNGSQLSVSNVIFQYCHGEVRDSHDYLAFAVHGEGDALVFTAGKAINAKWTRYDGDFTPAKFYDRNGDEIILNKGKTWICTIWQEYGEYARYESN